MKLNLLILSILSLNYLVACGSSSSSSPTVTPASDLCSDSFLNSYNAVTDPYKKVKRISESTWLSEKEKEVQMTPHILELHAACKSFYATQKNVTCRARLENETSDTIISGSNPKFKQVCDTVIEAFAKTPSLGSSSPTTVDYGTTTTTTSYNYGNWDTTAVAASARIDSIAASQLQFKVESEYSIRQLLVNPKSVMVRGRVTTFDTLTAAELRTAGTFCNFSPDQDLSKKLLGYPTLQPLVINDTATDGKGQTLLILMDNGVGLVCVKAKQGAHTLKEVKDALSGIIEVSVKP